MRYLWFTTPIFLLIIGCSDHTEETKVSLTESGMKCGAGKCGASMVDGNSIVDKKRKNILSQLREDDPRKACILSANTSKSLYNCIRDPKTKRLSSKCGNDTTVQSPMKCASGKCGGK